MHEDSYELMLTANFALRGAGDMPDASYSGLPTGSVSRKGVRRSSLTRYASQESLGKFHFHLTIISCFGKIQNGLSFWYRLIWVVPDKGS